MADTAYFVTLDYIIQSYLNWKNIAGVQDFSRYKQILIEYFTDMNLFHTTYYTSVIVAVNDVNQVALESDFIDWLMIGVVEDGLLWELDRNDNIVIEPDNAATTPVFSNHLSIPVAEGYRYTQKRRNIRGEFKVNKDERIITFVGDLKGKDIYIHYSSSGIPATGSVSVPRELVTVLRTYLDWQIKESDDSVPISIAQRAEDSHGRAMEQYYDNKDQLSGKELIDLFRNGIQQGIKR